MIRLFERHHTPRYDGSDVYDAVEEWLAAVQVTFHLSRTPEAYMAELATTLLDRDARHWWSSQEPQHEGGVQALSCNGGSLVESLKNALIAVV
jgi:hypothetical protein